jgi:MFS family permease
MNRNPYGVTFWWTYAANLSLTLVVSLLFRYSDFVAFLGGTEKQLGWITGIGMLGAIVSRCFQGVGIDRCGPRQVWLISLSLLVTSLLCHLAVSSASSPLLYGLRIAYAAGLAGAFGASLTFVSLSAPPGRTAEMIGMLGSSGFLGMALGPQLGDWILGGSAVASEAIRRMFCCASTGGLVSLVCAFLATRCEVHVPPSRRPPILALIRRYHPGPSLLVGLAMGMGIGMPGTFVRPFAAQLQISRVGTFFLVYAIVAFVVRVRATHLADKWGARPTILCGLGLSISSVLSFLAVYAEWMLVLPAALGGAAHALLFPAVVSQGSLSFPRRYRGLATNIILIMFDIGLLVEQPVLGTTIDRVRAAGGDGYFAAFVGLAVFLAGCAVGYAWMSRAAPARRRNRRSAG